jgi:hypothetical protein
LGILDEVGGCEEEELKMRGARRLRSGFRVGRQAQIMPTLISTSLVGCQRAVQEME